MKKILLLFGVSLLLCACGNETYDILESEKAVVQSEAKELNEKYVKVSEEYSAYKASMEEYEGLASAEVQSRKIEAESKANAESKSMEESKIAESLAKAESKAVASQARAESEAILQASIAAEEAIGYETGITYEQLARTPDDYKGKKIKFSGKVIQVMEGDGNVEIRFAVSSDYDSMLYCSYSSSITSSRVLENDKITIYGTSKGLLSYESAMGGTITIPSVTVDKIDQ